MKNKKGFTLIELLAVIVILGLLMAIAIPSVTKYITESRKKTVVSTIGNYITATVNEVNDLTYTFTEANTIYAVPIECIALERGGTNPFGAWYQANDAYWAYVLVQYDDETSSYRYGYTFKDSAGYGLYPTAQSKLNEGGKQIKTGLNLTRPKNGKVTSITAVDNWNGFSVDSTTNLVVLISESEGNIGNGTSTCTLQQKGDNYIQVEEEKKNINNDNNYDDDPVIPPETDDDQPGDNPPVVIEKFCGQDEKLVKGTCRVISGTGHNVGDMIACGGEVFYVMPDDPSAGEGTISLLAKYPITLTTNTPIQSACRSEVSTDNVSKYISAYANTLSSMGIKNVTTKLPSTEGFNCTYVSKYNPEDGTTIPPNTCGTSHTWFYEESFHTSSGCIYASVASPYHIYVPFWMSLSDINAVNIAAKYGTGARPLVIIPESEIQF